MDLHATHGALEAIKMVFSKVFEHFSRHALNRGRKSDSNLYKIDVLNYV